MTTRVNPNWLDEKQRAYAETGIIDTTVSFNKAAQSLVEWLSRQNIKFKVYNLGAGVKRITTDTEVCPCCKKKI